MDSTNDAGSAGSERPPIAVVTVPGDESLSVTAAARALATVRHKGREHEQQRPAGEQREGAQLPAADEGSTAHPRSEAGTGAGDAAAENPPPGEAESADRATQDPGSEAGTGLPPIEPPRSWTKEDKELFATLPRETQERLIERERLRETDFSKRQQTATEQAKALEAERLRAEQTRQGYESALPLLLQTLHQQQASEFADIKTTADVERLAREDWPRYIQWDLAQKKVAGALHQTMAAQQRQAIEQQQRFAEFAKRQDHILVEKVPELADAAKVAELQKSALAVLYDLGFEDTELGAAWHGASGLSLRDHRLQLLIRDATLWRQAQAKAKAAATKPVPPVQRPGTSQGQAAEREVALKNLDKQLDSASGVGALRAAARLVAARRAGR